MKVYTALLIAGLMAMGLSFAIRPAVAQYTPNPGVNTCVSSLTGCMFINEYSDSCGMGGTCCKRLNGPDPEDDAIPGPCCREVIGYCMDSISDNFNMYLSDQQFGFLTYCDNACGVWN